MTRARDLADLISSGKIELGEIATDTQSSLGNTDLYGFKKTNGTGSQLEDLIMNLRILIGKLFHYLWMIKLY